MVIDFGETEVFEGQMTEAFYGVVGGEAFFADLIEELAKSFGVHRCWTAIVDWLGCGEWEKSGNCHRETERRTGESSAPMRSKS
jgi:hypothetical protein